MGLELGAIQVLRNAIFLQIGPPPRNVNNIEHYTFVTFFPRKIRHPQGWVQLHKITSITITLKYQLQLQLHHHDVVLNYNYTMFISITITAPFLHKLIFYLWNCGLIGFGCFPCLTCCLVPTQPRNALRLHNIATSDSISCVGQLN